MGIGVQVFRATMQMAVEWLQDQFFAAGRVLPTAGGSVSQGVASLVAASTEPDHGVGPTVGRRLGGGEFLKTYSFRERKFIHSLIEL